MHRTCLQRGLGSPKDTTDSGCPRLLRLATRAHRAGAANVHIFGEHADFVSDAVRHVRACVPSRRRVSKQGARARIIDHAAPPHDTRQQRAAAAPKQAGESDSSASSPDAPVDVRESAPSTTPPSYVTAMMVVCARAARLVSAAKAATTSSTEARQPCTGAAHPQRHRLIRPRVQHLPRAVHAARSGARSL